MVVVPVVVGGRERDSDEGAKVGETTTNSKIRKMAIDLLMGKKNIVGGWSQIWSRHEAQTYYWQQDGGEAHIFCWRRDGGGGHMSVERRNNEWVVLLSDLLLNGGWVVCGETKRRRKDGGCGRNIGERRNPKIWVNNPPNVVEAHLV